MCIIMCDMFHSCMLTTHTRVGHVSYDRYLYTRVKIAIFDGELCACVCECECVRVCVMYV